MHIIASLELILDLNTTSSEDIIGQKHMKNISANKRKILKRIKTNLCMSTTWRLCRIASIIVNIEDEVVEVDTMAEEEVEVEEDHIGTIEIYQKSHAFGVIKPVTLRLLITLDCSSYKKQLGIKMTNTRS